MFSCPRTTCLSLPRSISPTLAGQSPSFAVWWGLLEARSFYHSPMRKKHWSGSQDCECVGIAPPRNQSLTPPKTAQSVCLALAADSSAEVEMQGRVSCSPKTGYLPFPRLLLLEGLALLRKNGSCGRWGGGAWGHGELIAGLPASVSPCLSFMPPTPGSPQAILVDTTLPAQKPQVNVCKPKSCVLCFCFCCCL